MLGQIDEHDIEPAAFWNITTARNGQLTATEISSGLHLHSAYNPEREAVSVACIPDAFEKSCTVFYGFGLGYHVVAWAKSAKNRKLVLIEPDTARFFAALKLLDWSPVFELQNLVIAVGAPAESVLHLIEDNKTINVEKSGVSDSYFFDIPAFQAHAASYFDTVKKIIKRNQRKNEINAATLKKFGKRWCRNSLENLNQIADCGAISGILKIIEDKSDYGNSLPFFIAGAGPTLEHVAPHLKEIKKRCIIITVETSLHVLLREGVQPDFIILTDPQFWAYRHISALHSPKSVLVTEISAYPSVFRFDCGKILLCSSQFPVGQYFENHFNLRQGDLGAGGSVSSSAWNFANFCGAEKVFIAGLDFAFPGNQTHIIGSSAEQTYHTVSDRITAADKYTAESIFNANGIYGFDYENNRVLTDSRMKMFAWWFESRLASCPKTKTYTLCTQSLKIPGIQSAQLSELLAYPEITVQKENFMKRVFEIKSVLSAAEREELVRMKNNFPSSDFLSLFPFLREYF